MTKLGEMPHVIVRPASHTKLVQGGDMTNLQTRNLDLLLLWVVKTATTITAKQRDLAISVGGPITASDFHVRMRINARTVLSAFAELTGEICNRIHKYVTLFFADTKVCRFAPECKIW